MSKQFKNKTCAYCTTPNSSTTGDHIFAREFFDEKHRHNLPKVPACVSCNNEKSKLEHYLTTVLPFASRMKDAESNLRQNVARRLRRNHKLDRSLARGMEFRQVERDGTLTKQMTLPFDGSKYRELFALMVRGLIVHHWNLYLPADYDVFATTVTKSGEGFFESYLGLYAEQQIDAILGESMFQYKGKQAVNDPGFSVWRFTFAGGAQVLGDNYLSSSVIYAMSAKKEIIEHFCSHVR